MGLGPVITTWTLGGPGIMKFGLKPKYYCGKATVPKKDDTGAKDNDGDGDEVKDVKATPAPKAKSKKRSQPTYITDDPVPLGCEKSSQRRELLQQLQSGKISPAQYMSRFEALMKDVTKPGQPRVVLEVPLVHGSFMVMHGDRMQ
jgi:hypothetical protein